MRRQSSIEMENCWRITVTLSDNDVTLYDNDVMFFVVLWHLSRFMRSDVIDNQSPSNILLRVNELWKWLEWHPTAVNHFSTNLTTSSVWKDNINLQEDPNTKLYLWTNFRLSEFFRPRDFDADVKICNLLDGRYFQHLYEFLLLGFGQPV